ncbi:zinc finger protein 804A isoform X2 [Mastomys coucha]|uniref:zinc finger protein 804A isoform X2 n=1 Tax=Mastomys coucha TaxID=35658 RepID=UPI00126149B1|nr:zinc finger protein 804A isoform X2 [Mastomys coucha]
MECYYIVISSTHLSNGHFRNIKGVFRGPLSKNGNKTLDYAEKENTIAKALEDLKANFYCELCDKQYYKHQEFDNHINSYDHAHKQRLKELKQREFARNVASKSRKDERKQEKALQRLHKLAELRKETVCAPGSGPMFKSTTVTVRENLNEVSQRESVDPINNQQDLIHSEEKRRDGTTALAETESASNCTANNCQTGDQTQAVHRHRIGFSFAFPKKALVRLESSSAAAFSEYSDESSSVEKEFSRKTRFVPGTCHLQLLSPTCELLSSEEKANTSPPEEVTCTDKPTAQTEEMKITSNENNTLLTTSLCQLQLPECSDVDTCQNSALFEDQVSMEALTVNEDGLVSKSNPDIREKNPTVPNDCTSAQTTTEENTTTNDVTKMETGNKIGQEPLTPSSVAEERVRLQKRPDVCKRQCDPFVPVLNKLGSTVLQWPSEMLAYTTTEPSISYSCNPLCFDFKSTKLNNSQDKNKLTLNDLVSQQKEDCCKGAGGDCKDVPIARVINDEIGSSKNGYPQVTTLSPVHVLSNGCDLGQNENVGQGYKHISCMSRKADKYNFSRCQIKRDTLHEKYNKIRLKETREHCFHKSRRKKKRRKLCRYHRGESTKEPERSSKRERDRDCTDEPRKNPLDSVLERQTRSPEKLSDLHQLQDERPKAASTHLGENETTNTTLNTESNNDALASHCGGKNATVINEQANPLMIHSVKQNLTYVRTYCCWEARTSRHEEDDGCFASQSNTKGPTQNQPVKRGYSSLTNDAERIHRKRRQNSCSYSSDESLNQQRHLGEEYLRPPSTSLTSCQPKKKRRRKRSRLHIGDRTMKIKDNSNYPIKCSSSLNKPDGLAKDGIKEEIKPQENISIEKNSEQIEQTEIKEMFHPYNPLPSEASGEGEHSIIETTPRGSSQTSNDLATPVNVTRDPSNGTTNNILLEHSQRSQTTNSIEKQIPFKVPHTERSFRHSQAKSYICRYELAETIPQGKTNEASAEWLCYNSGILNTQPPLQFKEAHVSGHAFVTTEQILAPLALPEQALLIPLENHDKLKHLPCEVYQHIIQPNILTNKVKFTFPPAPLPPPSTPVQPLPLQRPFCSTSVTTIHHTVLQLQEPSKCFSHTNSSFPKFLLSPEHLYLRSLWEL